MFGLRAIGLPDMVKELLTRPRGLILVTGPTGSGKSTILRSIYMDVNINKGSIIYKNQNLLHTYHPKYLIY